VSAVARRVVKAGPGSGGEDGRGRATRARGWDKGWCVEALTGIRSRYFWRIRSASALRFSKGCSSLNLDRILVGVGEVVGGDAVWCWS